MEAVYQKKPEYERDAKRGFERKTRKCLVCEVPFSSEWASERFCRNCKSRSEWRMGFRPPTWNELWAHQPSETSPPIRLRWSVRSVAAMGVIGSRR